MNRHVVDQVRADELEPGDEVWVEIGGQEFVKIDTIEKHSPHHIHIKWCDKRINGSEGVYIAPDRILLRRSVAATYFVAFDEYSVPKPTQSSVSDLGPVYG